MINFYQFLEFAREIIPIGTVTDPNVRKSLAGRRINSADAKKYLDQGFVYVYRFEGFAPRLRKYSRGVWYFIGDENDTKLDLGKCLLAWNKVHALHLLGFPNNYILFYINPANFLRLAADQNLNNRYINQVIKSHFNENGPTKDFNSYDKLDFPMTGIAKSQGYDTIMLVAEGDSKSAELIDLRTEVTPKSLEDYLKEIDVDEVMKDLKKKKGKKST
jgi:hypothetical protein